MRNRKILAAAAMSAAIAGGAVVGAAVGNPLASGASPGSTPAATTTAPANGNAPKGPMGMGDHGPRGLRGPMDLEAAAKVLKLSTDDLRTKLQSGKSLADIAKDQGVSRQDLIDALVKAGEARLDEEKKALPDQVAKLVDATPPTRGPDGDGPGGGLPGRPGNGGPGMPGGHMAPLDPAAKALGMSVDDLRTALKDGKTLAQVAKDKGVDPQKVIDALVAEAKTHLDQAVTDGHLTKDQAAKALDAAKTGITSWVNDGMPAFGPMGGPGRRGPHN